jgi:hypothetical protein
MKITSKKKELTHIIHGCPHSSYPTHTHGLEKIGLPELFINGKAFGTLNNASCLNLTVEYLNLYDSEREKIINKKYIEIKIFEDVNYIMCLRAVNNKFKGVTTAYYDEDLSCKTGFYQLYVKGDFHVLNDRYFIKQDKLSKKIPCDKKCVCNGRSTFN